MREGNLEAPTRHPLDWKHPDFHDEGKLMAELPGILQWAGRGYAAYAQFGLADPPAVLEASAEAARMSNVTTTHGAGHNEVLYEIEDGHIALITLNAPERMNTISGPMLGELTRLLVLANEDKAVRCVILTGAGRGLGRFRQGRRGGQPEADEHGQRFDGDADIPLQAGHAAVDLVEALPQCVEVELFIGLRGHGDAGGVLRG